MNIHFLLILLTFLTFDFSVSAASSLEDLVQDIAAKKLNLFDDKLLEPEQAFQFSADVKNGNTLYVNWKIAPEYYLYREKIKLELPSSNGTKLGDYFVPNGLPKFDEAFGKVEIFTESLNFDVPIFREDHNKQTLKLRAYFQGCAERGICYPPMTKEVILELPVAHTLEALPEMESQAIQVSNVPIIVLLAFSVLVLIGAMFITTQLKNQSAK